MKVWMANFTDKFTPQEIQLKAELSDEKKNGYSKKRCAERPRIRNGYDIQEAKLFLNLE